MREGTDAGGSPSERPVTVHSDARGSGVMTVTGGVLVMVGEIDTSMGHAWAQAVPEAPVVHTVDARGVTFFGSSGLEILAGLAAASLQTIVVQVAGRTVARPMQVTRLDTKFQIDD